MNDTELLELLKSNPALRKQLEAEAAKAEVSPEHQRRAEAFPRYVFDWESVRKVEEGMAVRIRNCFGQIRGGQVLRQVGRAWLVLCGESELVVHHWDDAWE